MITSPPIELSHWTRTTQRPMTLSEFTHYAQADLAGCNPRLISQIFLHHTWKPTIAEWRGYATILAMKTYYQRQLWTDAQGRQRQGWTAGPHIFVAPDGIWLFTDLNRDGIGVKGHNAGTRHVEMVGDYDQVPPTGDILHWTVAVLALLHRAFRLPLETLAFHRDVSTKTCPGSAVSKTDIIAHAHAWHNARQAETTMALHELLRQAAYNALDVPYTRSHALMACARAHALGAALTDEFEIQQAGITYVVQPFALGIVYCPKGRWADCAHVEW